MTADDLTLGKFAPLSHYDADAETHQLIRASLDGRFSEFLALPPGTMCADNSVIVGEAGYLFVNDGSNEWRKQLAGEAIVDDATAQRTRSNLEVAAQKCEASGIAFAVMVYPEKDIVYPEFSPNVKGAVAQGRSLSKLATSGVRFIYPAEAMIARKYVLQQFHKRNSHVQFYGGLIAANMAIRDVGRAPLQYEEIPTTVVQWPDDLSIKWVDGLVTHRRCVAPVFARSTVVSPANGHVGTHVETTNATAACDETVLIFGDSYSWNPDAGLVSFLSLRFRKVYFVWQKTIDWSLVDRLRPTVLFLQSAERFLVKGLASS